MSLYYSFNDYRYWRQPYYINFVRTLEKKNIQKQFPRLLQKRRDAIKKSSVKKQSSAASIAKRSVSRSVSKSTFLDNAMVIENASGQARYITYGDLSCQDFKNPYHAKVYKESIENQESFFDKEAKKVFWFKKYTKIIDKSD